MPVTRPASFSPTLWVRLSVEEQQRYVESLDWQWCVVCERTYRNRIPAPAHSCGECGGMLSPTPLQAALAFLAVLRWATDKGDVGALCYEAKAYGELCVQMLDLYKDRSQDSFAGTFKSTHVAAIRDLLQSMKLHWENERLGIWYASARKTIESVDAIARQHEVVPIAPAVTADRIMGMVFWVSWTALMLSGMSSIIRYAATAADGVALVALVAIGFAAGWLLRSGK
ncbi:MAG: hypothetical protein BWY76_02507 [bacterium ADurb.Bin429]|nr:MAG: hypothetical protein BWY76_02507 [bacterium ADurb.Bin429]